MYDDDSSQGIESENGIEAEELPKKRKCTVLPDEVPKLINEKHKHLEKPSASHKDQLLINEAREDTKFRKDLAMRKSAEPISQALEGISNSITQLGESICRTVSCYD